MEVLSIWHQSAGDLLVFQSVKLEGKRSPGFPPPPALKHVSGEAGALSSSAWRTIGVRQLAEHASLLWSGASVAIQTQINRGEHWS